MNNIDYKSIPPRLVNALMRYAEQGVPLGGFLTAVVSDNLREAVGRADQNNLDALASIVSYVYMELPGACNGSNKIYRAWINYKCAKAQGLPSDEIRELKAELEQANRYAK